MTREVAHQKSFEKALYPISPNFPPGKLPPREQFANVYYKMSHDGAVVNARWNSGTGLTIATGEPAVDGGDGSASVGLEAQQATALTAMATRLRPDPSSDPTTGAELGGTVAPTNHVG
jgi:Mn-containing catalase